ncbi:hypothetical protein F2P79_006651 [Pimephales promelas]|nr:hypothetical protein F2P79_006651 [Pimephales promelas]
MVGTMRYENISARSDAIPAERFGRFVLKGFACCKNEQLHLLKSTPNMEHLVAHTWLRRFPLDLPECVAFVFEC